MSIYNSPETSAFVANHIQPTKEGLILNIGDYKWNVHLPQSLNVRKPFAWDNDCALDALVTTLSRQPNPFSGTRIEHATTVCVLQANWSAIVSGLLKQPLPNDMRPSSYVDILIGPTQTGMVKQLDIIGDNSMGGVLVVEVGTNGKTKQLREQLCACREIFANTPVHGLLAYYSFNRNARTVRITQLDS